MNEIYACELSALSAGRTVQVGRLRGKIDQVAVCKRGRGTWGHAVVTLRNGRKLILSGGRKIKLSA